MLGSAVQRAIEVSGDPSVSVPSLGWLYQWTLMEPGHCWLLAFCAGYTPFLLMLVSDDKLLPIEEN